MATKQVTPHAHNFQDLTGQKYGRLTVLSYAGKNKRGRTLWTCRCECGATSIHMANSLRNGHAKSCSPGCGHVKHGCCRRNKNRTPEYTCWNHLFDRCDNPNNPQYRDYGGRGIDICDRWRKSFVNFFADMGPRPSPKYEIDRIDNNGNYEPNNCRWVTRHQQARNRSDNRMFTHDGLTLCITDWAERVGMSHGGMSYRLKHWPLEKALTIPKGGCRRARGR